MKKLKIQIEIGDCVDTQDQSTSISCTGCGELYEPASGYADIRCQIVGTIKI